MAVRTGFDDPATTVSESLKHRSLETGGGFRSTFDQNAVEILSKPCFTFEPCKVWMLFWRHPTLITAYCVGPMVVIPTENVVAEYGLPDQKARKYNVPRRHSSILAKKVLRRVTFGFLWALI
jgi:hypothetical protein